MGHSKVLLYKPYIVIFQLFLKIEGSQYPNNNIVLSSWIFEKANMKQFWDYITSSAARGHYSVHLSQKKKNQEVKSYAFHDKVHSFLIGKQNKYVKSIHDKAYS